ncbi:MAG: hypothetical protein M3277_09985 [Actinomycetota bacterium]|nr:hypothetical protein [Actinomycetota bacterium]
MDTTEVRTEAERHANATVAGDLKTAGASLTETARGQAGGVMKAMPGKLTACEIPAVQEEGDGTFLVDIRYTGENGDVTVRSTWGEIDGRPKITNLEVL